MPRSADGPPGAVGLPVPRTVTRALRWWVGSAIFVLAAAAAAWGVSRVLSLLAPPAPIERADLHAAFFDDRLIVIAQPATDDGVPWQVTVDDLRYSVTLWRAMHLTEWNNVPSPLREDGLDRMFAAYRPVLMDPRAWDAMSAADWDLVPQPMRTVAYRHMVAYWAGFYELAPTFDLPPGLVADTLAAIVMTESWFDHRAVHVNTDGSRDIGLGGASDYARDRLRRLYRLGLVDVNLDDADYVNPWMSARFVALWTGLMLDEAGGDLDLAVRAYHRGISAASDRIGASYRAIVEQRFSRFIRNHDAPPAWDYVWRTSRDLARAEWPWTSPAHGAVSPGGVAGPPRF